MRLVSISLKRVSMLLKLPHFSFKICKTYKSHNNTIKDVKPNAFCVSFKLSNFLMNLLLSDTHCLYVYKPIKFSAVFCFKVFHGCILENENDADGIKEVSKVLHKFVPYAGDDENRIYTEQGNAGDQLSLE